MIRNIQKMFDSPLAIEVGLLKLERSKMSKLKDDKSLYDYLIVKVSSELKAKQLLFKIFCWSRAVAKNLDYRLVMVKYGGLKVASEIELSSKLFKVDDKVKFVVPPISSKNKVYLDAARNLAASCEKPGRNESDAERTIQIQSDTSNASRTRTADLDKDFLQSAMKQLLWEKFISSLDNQKIENEPCVNNIDSEKSVQCRDQYDFGDLIGVSSIENSEVNIESSKVLYPETASQPCSPHSGTSSSTLSVDENSNNSVATTCRRKLINFEKIRTRNQGRVEDPHIPENVPIAELADDSGIEISSQCGNVFCNMGCVCDTLLTVFARDDSCGLSECVFHCSCTPVFLSSGGVSSDEAPVVAFVAQRPKRNVRPPSKIRDFAVVTNFNKRPGPLLNHEVTIKKKRMSLLDHEKLTSDGSDTPDVLRMKNNLQKIIAKKDAASKREPLFSNSILPAKEEKRVKTTSKAEKTSAKMEETEPGKKLNAKINNVKKQPKNSAKKIDKVIETSNSHLQNWLIRRQLSDKSGIVASKRIKAQKILAQASPFVTPVKNQPISNDQTKKSPSKARQSLRFENKRQGIRNDRSTAILRSNKAVAKQPFKGTKKHPGKTKTRSTTKPKMTPQTKEKSELKVAQPLKRRKIEKMVKNLSDEEDHVDLFLDASDEEDDNLPLLYSKTLSQFSSSSMPSEDDSVIKRPENENEFLDKKLSASAAPEVKAVDKRPRESSKSEESSNSRSDHFCDKLHNMAMRCDSLVKAPEMFIKPTANQTSQFAEIYTNSRSTIESKNLNEYSENPIRNDGINFPNEETVSDSFEKKYPFMARAPPQTTEERMKCARVDSTNFLLTCARCRPVSERYFMKNAIRAQQNEILMKWREKVTDNNANASMNCVLDSDSESNPGDTLGQFDSLSEESKSSLAEFKSTYVYLNGNRVEIFSNCNWSSKKLKIYETVLKQMDDPKLHKCRFGVFWVEIVDNLQKGRRGKLRHDFDNIRKTVVIRMKSAVEASSNYNIDESNSAETSKNSEHNANVLPFSQKSEEIYRMASISNNQKYVKLSPKDFLNTDQSLKTDKRLTKMECTETATYTPEAKKENTDEKMISQQVENNKISSDSNSDVPKPRKLIVLSKKDDFAKIARKQSSIPVGLSNQDLIKMQKDSMVSALDQSMACDETFDHSGYTFGGVHPQVSSSSGKSLQTTLGETANLVSIEKSSKSISNSRVAAREKVEKSGKLRHQEWPNYKIAEESLPAQKPAVGKAVTLSEVARAISQKWREQKTSREEYNQAVIRSHFLKSKMHASSLQRMKPSEFAQKSKASTKLDADEDVMAVAQKPIVIYRNISGATSTSSVLHGKFKFQLICTPANAFANLRDHLFQV